MKMLILKIVFFIASITFWSAKCKELNIIEIGISSDVKNVDLVKNITEQTLQKQRRNIRSPDTCMVPFKGDETYELNCTSLPSKKECIQKCMFGHTLPEGIIRFMKCRHSEDKWMPVPEFEQCRPFVDCTLSLGHGGYSKCTTRSMDKAPFCEVSCAHYEDKQAVPLKTYQCDVNGNWTPDLPFCARAGTGISLVSPPRGLKK